MEYTFEIDENELINAIESQTGGLYENIQESWHITNIKLRYGHQIEITIGEEEV